MDHLEAPDTELAQMMRTVDPRARQMFEVFTSLMLESENIKQATGLQDLPELKGARIAYKMPTLVNYERRGGKVVVDREEKEAGEGGGRVRKGKKKRFQLKVVEVCCNKDLGMMNFTNTPTLTIERRNDDPRSCRGGRRESYRRA